MGDDDRSVTDDELAALLRRITDDTTLTPRHRDQARTAMFAEFDAVANGTSGNVTDEVAFLVSPVESEEQHGPGVHSERRRRTFASAVLAVAAASVVVVALVAVANIRDSSSESLSTAPITTDALPSVDETLVELSTSSVPLVLEDSTYRTDQIVDGLTFSGAGGLQLVELEPELVVMDRVSDDGELRARLSIFEADERAVSDVIDAAVQDGRLQIGFAQVTAGGQSVPRRDLNVTPDGLSDPECTSITDCVALVDRGDGLEPSLWARAENFLVDVRSGEPSVFMLVQATSFTDPLLTQATEISESLRFD